MRLLRCTRYARQPQHDALLKENEVELDSKPSNELAIKDIQANKDQPRKKLESIEKLSG